MFIFKLGIVVNYRKDSSSLQPFTPKILILTHQQQTALENMVGKEEIARAISFFPTMLSTQSENCILFW